MKPKRHPERQRGAAAVELAFILPILILLMSFPLFLGRVFYHYTAMQKAAQDAARYLSTISHQEMRNPDLAEGAEAVAIGIITMELAELNPGLYPPRVRISCGNMSCAGLGARPMPETVSVQIQADLYDFLGMVEVGRYGLPLNVEVTMNYVGTAGAG